MSAPKKDQIEQKLSNLRGLHQRVACNRHIMGSEFSKASGLVVMGNA